mmetsp:Transcript_27378/g.63316  ORF Transcript_27378/g.63316 Transcript_27378/m.63316 type:complete len:211 (+) Transcript_27378:15-647(+)
MIINSCSDLFLVSQVYEYPELFILFMFTCEKAFQRASFFAQKLLANVELVGRSLHFITNLNAAGRFDKLGQFVKVQVTVCVSGSGVDLVHVAEVLIHRGQLSFNTGNGSQFGTGEVDVGSLSETVGEVSCRCRNNSASRGDTGLVTHAQRAPWHFCSSTCNAKDTVISFFDKLSFVHLGGWCHPQTSWNGLFKLLQELSSRTEMSNVGHA